MQYLRSNEIVANNIGRQTEQVGRLLKQGVVPHLTILRDVPGAERPDIRSYTAALRRHVATHIAGSLPLGRFVSVRTLPPQGLKEAVLEANENPGVHGVLVMSPTVENYDDIAASIDPRKDVDRMNPATREIRAADGKRLIPATPQAVRENLEHHNLWSPDLTYALAGRGRTVGTYVDEDLRDLHGSAYGQRVWVVTGSNKHELPDAIAAADVAIVAAGVRNQITRGHVHDRLRGVVGICIGDIDPSVYDIRRPADAMDLLVTPPHNHDEHWGIGAGTSSIAWGNTLEQAAALTALTPAGAAHP